MKPYGLFLMATAVALGALMSDAESRPNIIVIMADDLDAMGSIEHAMPELQALAAEGVTFTNAFVAMPVCGPNRVSFLTGQFPHNHGVDRNSAAYDLFAEREVDSLGPWVQAAGYETGIFGKYVSNIKGDPERVPPGWDDWRVFISPRYENFSLSENGAVNAYDGDAYSTDVLRDKAVEFISRARLPFFAFISPNAPHSHGDLPPIPAARHRGIFDNSEVPKRANFNEADVHAKPAWVQALPLFDDLRIAEIDHNVRKRREALRAVDEMIVAIGNALEERGVFRRTIIIFTSDNGFSAGSHRWETKGVPYEESVRALMIIRGPGIPAGEVRDHLVSTIDLTAYILQRAHATATTTLDGRSFVPIIAHPLGAPWRRSLLATGVAANQWPWSLLRTRRYASISYSKTGEYELYDMLTDPVQMTNLATEGPAWLARDLEQLRACSGDGCWIE